MQGKEVKMPAWRMHEGKVKVLAAIFAMGLTHHTYAQSAGDKELTTVTVSGATGYDQNITDAPASISVITREELEKQSYTSITDAVKNIPGVYVTGGGDAKDISIRGMTRAYTLYLVDGKPLSSGREVNTNGTDGGKQITLPPVSMIERIEVIRGPMSSLYGSEAMGGVINIITRKISNKWTGTVSGEYTKSDNDISNDSYQSNFYLAGPLVEGLLGLQVNGSYQHTDESNYIGGDADKDTGSRPKGKRQDAGAKLTLTPNKDNDIALSVQSGKLDNRYTPGKSVPLGATTTSAEYHKDVYALEHTGRYGNVQTTTYLQRDESEKISDQKKKESVTILNNQTSYFSGSNVFTFGGQYKKEKLTNEGNGLLTAGVPGAVAQMDRWLAAIFAEAEWGLTDKFALTTGIRYNRDELFGGHITPRIYGVYHTTPNFAFKGGVSTGYVQPSLSDATAGFGLTTGGGGWQGIVPHSRALIIGNPDLKPEKSTSFELGYDYTNPEMGFSSSLMFFHTKFKDKIAEDRFCSTDASGTANRNNYAAWACNAFGDKYYFLSTKKNISNAMMQGVELTADYQITRTLNITSSYTYTESEQKSGEFKGEPLTKTPKHMFNANLGWDATEKLNTWLQYNFRGKTSDYLGRTSMTPGTPSYGFYDAGLVYKATKNMKITAGIYNIGNKEITNDVYEVVLDGRRFTVGMTVDF